MKLSEKIASARKDAGKSQAQVAKEIGISLRTYQGYEGGEMEPKTDKRKKLEIALGKPAGYFMGIATLDSKQQMEYILSQTQALLAGGALSEEDKEAFMQELIEISKDSSDRKLAEKR
ncbi:helix-turn-helix domain-containing protein [Christensenellaceae bacterium OttesenSCG-928-K19]|nr:helix-turn-helix domain-containing protein [Christensenellaceae bacterium OttesenSCG-928-K19]